MRLTAQVKTNLDHMDEILEELRALARESDDLSGRLSAEVNGAGIDDVVEATAAKRSQASGRRGG